MLKKIINHKIFRFIILFAFIVFASSFTTLFANDEVWNYGFAKSIHDGLIPYKDFNMVLTPFYPFLMSLPMHIFGTNELVLIVFNAFFLAIAFILLEDVIDTKHYFVLLFLVFPLSIAFPSYNLLLFSLFIAVLYCQKNIKNNDIILGLLVGTMFITKQSVGGFIFLVLIFSVIKDKKRVLKRIGCFLIPIILCVLVLTINNAFSYFIDYCFLGLFDFGGNNRRIDLIGIVFIIEFIILLYFIWKKPKKIENYYILAYATMNLPMIDLYHTQLFNLAFIIALFLNINFSKNILKFLNTFSFAILIASQVIIISAYEQPVIYPNKLHNFEYRYITKTAIDKTNEVNNYIKSSDKRVVLLLSNAYYFKLINDEKIEKIDLLNYGNSGINGTKNNIKYIKNHKDCLFMLEEKDIEFKGQYDQEVLKYVVKNAKKIDTIGEDYSIFSFE